MCDIKVTWIHRNGKIPLVKHSELNVEILDIFLEYRIVHYFELQVDSYYLNK